MKRSYTLKQYHDDIISGKLKLYIIVQGTDGTLEEQLHPKDPERLIAQGTSCMPRQIGLYRRIIARNGMPGDITSIHIIQDTQPYITERTDIPKLLRRISGK